MPFIDLPIQCTVCRGSGEVRPGAAFRIMPKGQMAECLNCRGKGSLENKVFVNPPKVECVHALNIPNKHPTLSEKYSVIVADDKEVELAIVASKKRSYNRKPKDTELSDVA